MKLGLPLWSLTPSQASLFKDIDLAKAELTTFDGKKRLDPPYEGWRQPRKQTLVCTGDAIAADWSYSRLQERQAGSCSILPVWYLSWCHRLGDSKVFTLAMSQRIACNSALALEALPNVSSSSSALENCAAKRARMQFEGQVAWDPQHVSRISTTGEATVMVASSAVAAMANALKYIPGRVAAA
jgi:hypothetical protein